MYKIFFLLLIGLLISVNTKAQNVINFELKAPKAKVAGNLYHSISIVDERSDTTDMGFVKTGFFDRKGTVIPKPSLSVQLSKYFYKAVDTTGKAKEIVMLLRQSTFNVINVGSRDVGTFSFRAGLYQLTDKQFMPIRSIDTAFSTSSAMTVTTKLLETANEIMGDFISANVAVTATGPKYSYHDILHIDSIEELNIKLYNTPAYTDGLYLTYKTFMNQTPDMQITVESGDVNSGVVKTIDANGNMQKIKPQKVYALVSQSKPYISSRGKYYPLKKDNGEFYFTGAVQVSSGLGNIILSSGGFGVLGALAASGGSEAAYYVKLDHINGSFIPVKKIEDPAPIAVSSGE